MKILIGNLKMKKLCITKFLGIYNDNELTWSDHEAYISINIAKTTALSHEEKNLLFFFLTIFFPPHLAFIIRITVLKHGEAHVDQTHTFCQTKGLSTLYVMRILLAFHQILP